MPETRVVSITYGEGGYDPNLPNDNIIEQTTREFSDEELALEAVLHGCNSDHEQLLLLLKDWPTLNDGQKLIRMGGCFDCMLRCALVLGEKEGLFSINWETLT